jgi:hypothetical protein
MRDKLQLTGTSLDRTTSKSEYRSSSQIQKLSPKSSARTIPINWANPLKLRLTELECCAISGNACTIARVELRSVANMSSFEDLLGPDSTELPGCRCGAEMRLFSAKPRGDTEIRIFRCEICQHELQLMVWKSVTEKN